MADTRKIVIEINNVDNESRPFDYGVTDSGTPQAPKQVGNATAKDNNEGKKILGKSVVLNQAFNQAKSLVINSVRRDTARYFNLSEDYLGENTFNFVETSVNKVVGLGTAIAGGAMVGGITGALIGATAWGVGEAIDYRSRMSGYYQSLNASRYQSEFSSKRAGLTDGSKGTEN